MKGSRSREKQPQLTESSSDDAHLSLSPPHIFDVIFLALKFEMK
jgi:hypothetical protein